jgi:hypothetical protein
MSPGRAPKGLPMELLQMTPLEIRRLEAIQRAVVGDLRQAQAAEQLRMSLRQFKRLVRRYRAEGPAGLLSRRRGRPSNHRVDPTLVARAVELVRTKYPDFGPTLACEKLAERDHLVVRRETLRKALIAASIWTPHQRRTRCHPPRRRRPMFGELMQADGSPHAWFEQRAPRCTLLVLIDDATSSILNAHFAPVECTAAYFALMRGYLECYGRPLALYVDRHGIFTNRYPDREKADLPQFARAMAELDIELICANSPQAKGRVERANGVLQDRLVKELRLRNIGSIDAANAFLPEFLEAHNQRFSVVPQHDTDAHRQILDHHNLDRILCSAEWRSVSKNLTVQYESRLYQLTAHDDRRRLAYSKVFVRNLPSGIVFEWAGRELPFELINAQHRRTVLDAKELDAVFEQKASRIPNPAYQRKPATTHPWKKAWKQPNKLTPAR